ncbi:hypothetical protein AKJ09_00620 [Labilithrix luteola]|uniref:Uncharacterized protein n=1 Tax=Labilithrix luteola TaxID=1391654 RepID=A0A0K1PKN5_9BACT|nr:hypothetical protein AKJ09_00620 [Labilithrix luteola]
MGLMCIAACATTGDDPPDVSPSPDVPHDDGGSPADDAGAATDGRPPPVDLDAEKALVCGDSGYCETRLPTSSWGEPLSLRAVWMVDPNDVWSVTEEGVVLHWDGNQWSISYQGNHPLYAIWATRTSVWAAGQGGNLLRRGEGNSWSRVETNHIGTIRAIYGTADDDVWITRGDGGVDHFDGTSLQTQTFDIPNLEITTVFGREGFGTYVAGYVKGPVPDDRYATVPHVPWVRGLTGADVTEFDLSFSQAQGVVPVAGAVTNSPDATQRVALSGYLERFVKDDGKFAIADLRYIIAGKDGVVRATSYGNPTTVLGQRIEPPPILPLWTRDWTDVRFPFHFAQILTWNGVDEKRSSIDMGYDFVPRKIFGIQGDATVMWLVGDGFAVRGGAP